MKRAILLILIGIVIGGGVVWVATHSNGANAKPDSDEAAKKSAGEEEDKITITHDTNDNVVISMSDEKQGDIGIAVTNPTTAELAREIKGYGRVADPAPLAALMAEVATTQAAYSASSNELVRLKTLEMQGNTSARALQAAEAAALRDQLAAQSAKDRLSLSWGAALAERTGEPSFIQKLTSLENALVRIDIPAGENLESLPSGARVVKLSGGSTDAEFLCLASSVDPQVQGRGFIFLDEKNSLHLLAGEAVTGYLKIPGEPLKGVIIPRNAVVRTEGKGWVYVLNGNGESFTRKEIPLDHATENGWFVANGVTAGDHVVVIGAQVLLSEELKASMSAD